MDLSKHEMSAYTLLTAYRPSFLGNRWGFHRETNTMSNESKFNIFLVQ